MLLGEFFSQHLSFPNGKTPHPNLFVTIILLAAFQHHGVGAQGNLSLSSSRHPICLSLEGGDLCQKHLLHPLKSVSTPRHDMSSLSGNQLYSTFPSHPFLHSSPPILSESPPWCRQEACSSQGPSSVPTVPDTCRQRHTGFQD